MIQKNQIYQSNNYTCSQESNSSLLQSFNLSNSSDCYLQIFQEDIMDISQEQIFFTEGQILSKSTPEEFQFNYLQFNIQPILQREFGQVFQECSLNSLKDKNISRILIKKFYRLLSKSKEFSECDDKIKNEFLRQKTRFNKLFEKVDSESLYKCLSDLTNLFGLKYQLKNKDERGRAARKIGYEIYQGLGIKDQLEKIVKIRETKKIVKKKHLQKIKRYLFHLKAYKFRCRSIHLISRTQII